MGYWIWYLVVALLAWSFRLPWLAVVGVALALAYRRLPEPVEWLRARRATRELTARVEGHPGDLAARRALARVYLAARHGARDAAALLEEAIAKGLDDPEAFYLLGLARLRAGELEGSLEPFVRATIDNPKALLGEPYLGAAEALTRLGRLAEAEDALERALETNSSRVDAHVELGALRRARGDREGARRALEAAVDTWRALPGYLRWASAGSYARARWRLLTDRGGARTGEAKSG